MTQKTIALKQISVNDITLHYIEQGKGSPMVLVHGGLSDYRMWEGQMQPFSEKHHVVAYSRRYAYPNKITGDSVGYSVVPHARDLATFIKALNVGPVHLVGHSYGAYTSLLTAIQHPELVKSLSLGEPPVMSLLKNTIKGSALFSDFETNTVLASARAFERGEELEAVKIFLNGVMGGNDFYDKMPPEVQQQINDNIPELRGLTCSNALSLTLITSADIKKLQMPTLLITGDSSPEFFIAIADEVYSCLLNKERVIIPRASHEMEMDNPEAFNEAVLRFTEKYD